MMQTGSQDSVETGNADYIRMLNSGVVLSTIHSHEPISRAAIAKHTGLSRSTCSLIADDLLQRNLIREIGKDKSSGGRRGVLLTMNYDAGVTVGARLLADSVDCAVVSLRGDVLKHRSTAISYHADVDTYINVLCRAVSETIEEYHAVSPGMPVFGIGLGLSGLVDSASGESVASSILQWDHIPLASRAQEQLKLPVYIDNDVNTFALGELWFGHGRGVDSFLCVTVGEGIGLGVVINGAIYSGSHHGAGEFGHTRISDDPQAPRDALGIQGSVEAFSADPAVCAYLEQQIRQGASSLLEAQSGEISIDQAAEAARRGDALALEAFNRAGKYLGIGIANLISLFDPEMIILGGEGCAVRDLWQPAMEETVREQAAYGLHRRVRWKSVEFDDDLWVRGIASLVLKEVFEGRAQVRD